VGLVASAAGLRRDERGLEGQRGRSRGKEGGGQRVGGEAYEWWLNMSIPRPRPP